MEIFTEIIGNIYQDPQWSQKAEKADVENLNLDQWTAQKSRFVIKSDKGNEYAISLKRHNHLVNGDVLSYDPATNKMLVFKIELSPVLIIELSGLLDKGTETIIQTTIELGHALGNQHWPAVVKDMKVFVPLTVDKKVMLSVMHTHDFQNITYDFHPGTEVIPYLSPHEIRKLFGGTGPDSDVHHHHDHHDD